MEEAEKWLKHHYRVYCLGRISGEGDPSKKVRAHYQVQAWARYRGLLEKSQEGH
jgi:hypothetical protein